MNFGNKSNQPSTTRIKKQDSYLQAIGNTEDELTPLPKRASVRKQESYQRAMMAGGVGSFTQGKIRFSSRSITSISQITNRHFFWLRRLFFQKSQVVDLFYYSYLYGSSSHHFITFCKNSKNCKTPRSYYICKSAGGPDPRD